MHWLHHRCYMGEHKVCSVTSEPTSSGPTSSQLVANQPSSGRNESATALRIWKYCWYLEFFVIFGLLTVKNYFLIVILKEKMTKITVGCVIVDLN